MKVKVPSHEHQMYFVVLHVPVGAEIGVHSPTIEPIAIV